MKLVGLNCPCYKVEITPIKMFPKRLLTTEASHSHTPTSQNIICVKIMQRLKTSHYEISSASSAV